MFENINFNALWFELGTYTFCFICGVFITWFFIGIWWSGLILGGIMSFIMWICYNSAKDATGTNFIQKSKEKEWWVIYKKMNGVSREELARLRG